MTDHDHNKSDETIESDELDWERAEVHPGRLHGTVVSVRLSAAEADHLRELASQLDLTMSQVLRRALAEFESLPARQPWQVFTYGGVDWPHTVRLLHPDRPHEPQPTSTELRPRIRERVS
jgi:hypothetical protein